MTTTDIAGLRDNAGVPDGVWKNPIYEAADRARNRHLRDVDANDQMGALVAAIDAASERQAAEIERLRGALKSADHALAQVTAFECDAREIMGNTNFEIVKHERERVRAALTGEDAITVGSLDELPANAPKGSVAYLRDPRTGKDK
jgi:hypothetical protein